MLRSALLLLPAGVLSSVLWAASAFAGGRFELDWTAPVGCPDQAHAEARLKTLLGAAPEALLSGDFTASVRIVARGDGFDLFVETRSPDGTRGSRQLNAAGCDEIGSAGAVIIALAISPEALNQHAPDAIAAFELVEETEPVASGHPPHSVTGATPSPVPPATMPLPPRRPGPEPALPSRGSAAGTHDREARAAFSGADGPGSRLGVTLLGALDVGTLPGVAPGVVATVFWNSARLRVELGASAFPARFAATEHDPSKGGSIGLIAVHSAACYLLHAQTPALAACAGLELGRLAGDGQNLQSQNNREVVPWLAALAGLELGLVRREPFALVLRGQALVPFGRVTFRYRSADGFERLHEPASVAARLGLGFQVSF